MYLFPARALNSFKMDGIRMDRYCFGENVRYTLREWALTVQSAPRYAISKPIQLRVVSQRGDDPVHRRRHVGPGPTDSEELLSRQRRTSLTSFYDEKAKLTDDLRVLVKVVALRDDALARTITENSSNQNAIKPTRFAISPRDHAPPAEGNVDSTLRLLFQEI